MPHQHEAYTITDDIFTSFINNNRKWMDEMAIGGVIDIVHAHEEKTMDVCSLDVMEYPWHVKYIGKHEGGEGPVYVFLDEQMNKLYSYYDVM